MEIIYQNRRGIPPLAYCCHLVLVVGCSDLFPHLGAHRMSSYSLPLPASVAITRNSFGSVWTSSHYSAQPPTPNLHKTSPMHSLVHPIGSCKGPACVAHPYPFLSVSVTWSSIESHYYIASGRAASGRVTLPARVLLHRVTLHQVVMHRVTLHRVALHRVALHRVCSPLLSLSL